MVSGLARRRRASWTERMMEQSFACLFERVLRCRFEFFIGDILDQCRKLLAPFKRGTFKQQGEQPPFRGLPCQAELILTKNATFSHDFFSRIAKGAQLLRILRAPASLLAPFHTAKAMDVRVFAASPSGTGRTITTAHPSLVRTPLPFTATEGFGARVPGPSANKLSTGDSLGPCRRFPTASAGA